jgi:hypothetical protein
MRSRVSELRKKEEAKWLRKHPSTDAKEMHRDKKVNKKIQVTTMRKAKALKPEWRIEWHNKSQKARTQRFEPKNSEDNKDRRKDDKTEKGDRIGMHKTIKLTVNNERGINAIAKRQQLARQWEEEEIDVALMGETNKNTGGMEDGSSWGNEYVVFFSTGIKPKVREEQETKRLTNWEKAQKKSRKKRGRLTHHPLPRQINRVKEKKKRRKGDKC